LVRAFPDGRAKYFSSVRPQNPISNNDSGFGTYPARESRPACNVGEGT
jgi:hypothetical protein